MKISIAVTAGALVMALAAPAAASPREYSRGYYDCLAGRFDPTEPSHAYRQGCRAAERERGEQAGAPCPPGYPGCQGAPRPPRPGQPGWNPGWGPDGGRPFPAPGGTPNVVGLDSGRATAVLAASGYRNVGSGFGGGAVLGIFFNPATGDCLEVANAGGRVANARFAKDRRCR